MESTESEHTTIIMSEVMTPEKANFSGNIHGGYLLQLLDRVAYACAAQYARTYVVTLSVDRVLFKQPIHVGEIVTCYAAINYVGRSSMEVGIKVVSQNILTGEKRHTNTCYCTMVAVDEQLKPKAVPPLTLTTPTQRRRFEEGKMRRELRIHFDKEHSQRKQALQLKTKDTK